MNNEDIVKKVIEKINEMSVGTEFTIYNIIKDYKMDYKSVDLLKISIEVLKKAEELNLILESKYGDGATIGLPCNITYIKK